MLKFCYFLIMKHVYFYYLYKSFTLYRFKMGYRTKTVFINFIVNFKFSLYQCSTTMSSLFCDWNCIVGPI